MSELSRLGEVKTAYNERLIRLRLWSDALFTSPSRDNSLHMNRPLVLAMYRVSQKMDTYRNYPIVIISMLEHHAHSTGVAPKKTLVFEIQIRHILLNSSDKNCTRQMNSIEYG